MEGISPAEVAETRRNNENTGVRGVEKKKNINWPLKTRAKSDFQPLPAVQPRGGGEQGDWFIDWIGRFQNCIAVFKCLRCSNQRVQMTVDCQLPTIHSGYPAILRVEVFRTIISYN